eukprot:COSAG02_NODE_4585_length_5189_cov_9.203929_6_plen_58_part_00
MGRYFRFRTVALLLAADRLWARLLPYRYCVQGGVHSAQLSTIHHPIEVLYCCSIDRT